MEPHLTATQHKKLNKLGSHGGICKTVKSNFHLAVSSGKPGR